MTFYKTDDSFILLLILFYYHGMNHHTIIVSSLSNYNRFPEKKKHNCWIGVELTLLLITQIVP